MGRASIAFSNRREFGRRWRLSQSSGYWRGNCEDAEYTGHSFTMLERIATACGVALKLIARLFSKTRLKGKDFQEIKVEVGVPGQPARPFIFRTIARVVLKASTHNRTHASLVPLRRLRGHSWS